MKRQSSEIPLVSSLSQVSDETQCITRSTEVGLHNTTQEHTNQTFVDDQSIEFSNSTSNNSESYIPEPAIQKEMTASPSSDERVAPNKVTMANRVSTTTSTASSANNQQAGKLKNWEIFPGRNKFLCDGRIMMARQTGIFYLTLVLIVVTVILFFVFELTLVPLIPYGFFIPIVCALLFLFNLACLFRTAWSDPGIIPRASPEDAAYTEKCLLSQEVREDGTSNYRPPPRALDIVVNGVPIKLKYCFTCKLFRPPRASHCSVCDNCVENFDHHCPWVGNCVGKRNYRYFFLFVSSLTILCLFIFAFAITNLVLLSLEHGFPEALKMSPGTVLELIVSFLSLWSVAGLTGFHSYLIVQSVTTNEDIKGTWSKKRKDVVNPFDRGGCLSNFGYTLCSPLPPSFIDRRGIASQDRIDAFALTPRGMARNGIAPSTNQHSNKPYPVQPTFPKADTETYDTSTASYPRQPTSTAHGQHNGSAKQATAQNSTSGSESQGGAQSRSSDEAVSITVSHHALPAQTSPTSFNSNNSIGFQQSHYPLPAVSIPADDHNQPGLLVEHHGSTVANGAAVNFNTEGSETVNVMRTDAKSFLLDEKPKLNGSVSAERYTDESRINSIQR